MERGLMMAKILLIDDDENIHEIVSLFLGADQHEVISALDAPSGITMAENEHPDLIMLDLAMPGMDGTEAYRILKANSETAEIPVMIFTVYDPEDLPDEICNMGCAGYLTKPVNGADLRDRIRAALS